MYHRHIWKVGVFALMAISLLTLLGLAVMGGFTYSHSTPPVGRPGSGRLLGLAPVMCVLALLPFAGLFLLLLVVGGLFFRRQAWKAAGGQPSDGPRAPHWGPCPPWGKDQEESARATTQEQPKDEPR
jgi:hypothetical protein